MAPTPLASSPTPPPARLLASREAWLGYGLVWVVFGATFAGLFWLRRSGTVAGGLTAAVTITAPAALLGIVVIRLLERTGGASPLRPRRALGHVLGSLAYSVAWIGSVNLVNNLLALQSPGPFQWRVPPEHVLHWHLFTGTTIYAALVAVHHARGTAAEADRRRRRAEARELTGQLHPHFLHNTLHALVGMAPHDPAGVEEGVGRLSRLLRYALQAHGPEPGMVPLRQELGFVEDYLALEAWRADRRLAWSLDVPEELQGLGVPPMLLQPLVENVVRHATVARPGGVTLTVAARREAGGLRLRVEDDGPGCAPADADRATGIGLRALRARIAALSPATSFRIETGPGTGFRVVIDLPELPADGIPQPAEVVS